MTAYRPLSASLLIVVLGGCGGVSAERVSALEAQVEAIKQQQSTSGDGSAALRQDFDKRLAAVQETQKKLEETMETLGTELGETVARRDTPKAPAKAANGADLWSIVSRALGMPVEGKVRLEGDVYGIDRNWFADELRYAASTKQLPKLVVDKKANGVAVRGIKPKSLLDTLGVRNNDVVVAVGGKPTPGLLELLGALRGASAPVAVTLVRKGAEVKQQYTFTD